MPSFDSKNGKPDLSFRVETRSDASGVSLTDNVFEGSIRPIPGEIYIKDQTAPPVTFSAVIESSGKFVLRHSGTTAEAERCRRLFEEVVLDRESVGNITVSDLRALRNKVDALVHLSRDESSLFNRLNKVHDEELVPILAAQALAMSGAIVGRSPAGIGDIAMKHFGRGKISHFEIKIIPHFSKFLDQSDPQKRMHNIAKLADKLKNSPDSIACLVPLDSVRPEAMRDLKRDLEKCGIEQERILCVHNQILREKGSGFEETLKDGFWRVVHLPLDRDRSVLFNVAASILNSHWANPLPERDVELLKQSDLGALLKKLSFYRSWPNSALAERAIT